jgi:hypothetical protein
LKSRFCVIGIERRDAVEVLELVIIRGRVKKQSVGLLGHLVILEFVVHCIHKHVISLLGEKLAPEHETFDSLRIVLDRIEIVQNGKSLVLLLFIELAQFNACNKPLLVPVVHLDRLQIVADCLVGWKRGIHRFHVLVRLPGVKVVSTQQIRILPGFFDGPYSIFDHVCVAQVLVFVLVARAGAPRVDVIVSFDERGRALRIRLEEELVQNAAVLPVQRRAYQQGTGVLDLAAKGKVIAVK